MANRRLKISNTVYRQVLAYMRFGKSDRQIAKARLMGRTKASAPRRIATEKGWLTPKRPLPVHTLAAVLKPLRTPQDEDIHDLIGERYERRSTIITSNLDLSEWPDAFPNKLLGAATIDRIRHGAYCVVLEGKSYRTPKPLPKPQKKEVEKTEKSSKN